MKKWIPAIVIFCFLLVIQAGCSGKKVDLSTFADIKIDGSDGKGTASVSVNWGDFEDAVLSESEINSLSAVAKIIELQESVKYSLDKTEGLSNGDKVTMIVTWDKDVAKKYKMNFSTGNKEVVVEGLQTLTELDLFADVHVEYEGVAPEANAIIRNASNDAFLKSINYYADNTFNLSNGDTVIVKVSITQEDAEKNGYYVSETEKAYIVSGIDEYITDAGLIDGATLDKMEKQAEDLVDSSVVSDYGLINRLYPVRGAERSYWNLSHKSVNVQERKLVQSYFFSLKEGMEKGYDDVYNMYYMIYEVKFTTNITKSGETDLVYLPVRYKNIVKRDDGTLDVVTTDAAISSANSNDLDNVYRDIVTANKAKYDYKEIP